MDLWISNLPPELTKLSTFSSHDKDSWLSDFSPSSQGEWVMQVSGGEATLLDRSSLHFTFCDEWWGLDSDAFSGEWLWKIHFSVSYLYNEFFPEVTVAFRPWERSLSHGEWRDCSFVEGVLRLSDAEGLSLTLAVPVLSGRGLSVSFSKSDVEWDVLKLRLWWRAVDLFLVRFVGLLYKFRDGLNDWSDLSMSNTWSCKCQEMFSLSVTLPYWLLFVVSSTLTHFTET